MQQGAAATRRKAEGKGMWGYSTERGKMVGDEWWCAGEDDEAIEASKIAIEMSELSAGSRRRWSWHRSSQLGSLGSRWRVEVRASSQETGKEEPAATQACASVQGMREKFGEQRGRERYLYVGKAARGCARARSPIGGTPNPAGQTPESK